MNRDTQRIIRNILNDVRVELSDEFDRLLLHARNGKADHFPSSFLFISRIFAAITGTAAGGT